MECIFCKIIKKELPADIIYEDGKSLVFLDISPVSAGHCLVVPKKHYENLLLTPDELTVHLIQVTRKVAQAAAEAMGAAGVNININNGRAAGQAVFHTHFHIIPRYKGDGLKLWPGKPYKDEQEKKEVAQKIKAKLT